MELPLLPQAPPVHGLPLGSAAPPLPKTSGSEALPDPPQGAKDLIADLPPVTDDEFDREFADYFQSLPSSREYEQISLDQLRSDDLMPSPVLRDVNEKSLNTKVMDTCLGIRSTQISNQEIDDTLKIVRSHIKSTLSCEATVRDDPVIKSTAQKLGFASCHQFQAASLNQIKGAAERANIPFKTVSKMRKTLSSRKSAKLYCGQTLARHLVKLLIVTLKK